MWVEESLSQKAFSLLADECTDISTIDVNSLSLSGGWTACWALHGVHWRRLILTPFMKLWLLEEERCDDQQHDWNGIWWSSYIFWETHWSSSPFKKEFTSLNFVHCHCHLLQLAQASNSTHSIKHVYTTLTTLWKYFHYSPKQAECLREVQTSTWYARVENS